MKDSEFSFYVDHEELGEIEVTYSVTPFIDQTYWQPAEGGEVEIITITRNGKSVDLTDNLIYKMEKAASARAQQDMSDAYADECDYRYEEYRDRNLQFDD